MPEGQELLPRSKDTTFASVLANRSPLTDQRFTILANPTEPGSEGIIREITASSDYKECGALKKIEKRSPNAVHIVATSSETADCIKRKVAEKYGTKVTITQPRQLPEFMIKITGCETDEEMTDPAQFINDLMACNECFIHYDVRLSSGSSYRNYIIKTTPQIHKEIAMEGKLIQNMASLNAYEYCDILQCKSCLEYGHWTHKARLHGTYRLSDMRREPSLRGLHIKRHQMCQLCKTQQSLWDHDNNNPSRHSGPLRSKDKQNRASEIVL